MARRKYTREFKISAVKLVNEQGYSVVDAAKSLGVDRLSLNPPLSSGLALVEGGPHDPFPRKVRHSDDRRVAILHY